MSKAPQPHQIHPASTTGELQPAPRKRARPGSDELQERRRDLLAAARKLLRKGGANAVTMRAVADMVGMSTTVVYAMFPDKASLIAHALDDDLKRLTRHLQQAQRDARDARDALVRIAQAYVAFGVEHPQSYRLMFLDPRPAIPEGDVAGEQNNPRQQAFSMARRLAADLLRTRLGTDAPAQEIEAMAQLFWQALHGITALRITLDGEPWLERVSVEENVQRMMQVFLDGLEPR